MDSETGKTFEFTKTVEASHLASYVGSGYQDVLSTPTLVAWMESASVNCLDLQDSSLCSLGVKIDVNHIAATPPGCKVTVKSTILSVQGRKYTFEVMAFDEHEKIGYGIHERVVTNAAKFCEKVNGKATNFTKGNLNEKRS